MAALRTRRRPEHDDVHVAGRCTAGWLPDGADRGRRPTATPTPARISLVAGDADVRQHRLRAARRRPRPGEGRADRLRHGHQDARSTATRPRPRRPERGVSPLEMANAYATIAAGGWRNRPTAITQGRVPRRPRRRPRQAARKHQRVLRRRHRTRRRRSSSRTSQGGTGTERDADRLPGRRQDRHDRQLHRRLVRRLHAAPVDRRLGRLRRRRDEPMPGSSPAARSRRRSGAST